MTPCPACDSPSPEVFCTLRQLPVHGTIVCETREQALVLPKADQVLTVCHDCGLVFNSTFDPSLLDYAGHHEESQASSATWRAFAGDLVQGWVDRYRLAGELVLEVGCGKGGFLQLLAEAGVGRAHGVDPGLDPSRLPPGGTVTGEVATFSPSQLSRSAAAVVCRHTLEHIPAVASFLSTIVQGIDPTRCRAVLFEVPDLGRVLDEAAFWDLQYEHCSSFTSTSLVALFRRLGLDVLSLRLVYGGQYLVVEADPTPGRAGRELVEVPPVEAVVARCRAFALAVDEQVSHWSSWFADRADRGQEVVVWGGGAKGSVFLSMLPESGVRRVVDINPGLQGRWMGGPGVPIVTPEALRDDPPTAVLLMNPIYLDEVRRTLDGLGLNQVELLAV